MEPANAIGAAPADWREGVPTRSGGFVALGVALFGVFVAGFLAWAAWLPLHSAVVVPGKLVPGGLHQKVQHQGGGRVVAIRARDGDRVERGEPIVVLDPVADRAEMTRLAARRARLEAARARLEAELRGEPLLSDVAGALALRGAPTDEKTGSERTGSGRTGKDAGPRDGLGSFDLRTGTIAGALRGMPGGVAPAPADRFRGDLVEAHRGEYRAGRAKLGRELEGLTRQRAALAHQREGLALQADAQRDLAAMTRDELARVSPLAARGYVAKSRARDLERTIAEIEARASALAAEGRGLDERIAEVDARIEGARERDRKTLAQELGQAIGELSEIDDALRAARAAVDRAVVRAPVSGTVVKMTVGTLGGVVASGDVIAEIVPRGAGLVAEGRVRPADIGDVAVGQAAEVVVTAHDRRSQRPLPARVAYVAADTQRDEGSDDTYYVVRLDVDAGAAPMQAGMQAELYLHAAPRTFLDYVLEPLADSFRRAFQER